MARQLADETGHPHAVVEEHGRRWVWRYDWYLKAVEREQAYLAKYPGQRNVLEDVRVLHVCF